MKPQQPIDKLWTHLPYEEDRFEIADSMYRVKLQKHITLYPKSDSSEFLIQDPKGNLYRGNVETLAFLQWYFDKNKKTGECYNGIYSATPLQIILGMLDMTDLQETLGILIENFGVEKLALLKVIETFTDETNTPKPYTSQRESKRRYDQSYKPYGLDIKYLKDSNEQNTRAEVYLTTRDDTILSNFVSMGYLERSLREHQEQDIMSMNSTNGEMFSPYGICIPHMVILEEVTENNIRKTIDDLIDTLSIESHFRQVVIQP